MEERVMKYLIDNDNSIAEIEGYFLNIPKEFNSYRQNTMLKRAVERNLEIIGEAVKMVSKETKPILIKSQRQNQLLVYGIWLFTLTTVFLTKIFGRF